MGVAGACSSVLPQWQAQVMGGAGSGRSSPFASGAVPAATSGASVPACHRLESLANPCLHMSASCQPHVSRQVRGSLSDQVARLSAVGL